LPVNQRRAEVVAALSELAAQSGISLPHLALGFVRAHPAVTAVLIGPRTPAQLDGLLQAADITLPGDVLDRVDELVPPGTEVNPADNYNADPPAIRRKELRRR
jgi:aryl-alcohol dehydrogenase-like predicted oxidoreductase